MSEALRKRMHQLAAIALLLGVAGAAVAMTVLPAAGYIGGLRTDIGERRELLGRLEAFTSARDKVERMARQTGEALQSGIFLAGDTDSMRAANLQALLNRVAGSAGIRLRSARVLPPAERDGLHFTGIQAEMDTGVEQLQALIAALEAARPYLFIQSLQISPHDMRGGGDELKVRIGIAAAGGKG